MSTAGAPHVVVIGGGFAGLSAAWEMVRRGLRVTVCEAEDDLGGLAGSFEVGGTRLEKFYHHWFTSDTHVLDLVRELGHEDQVLHRPTRTGMYFAHHFFRLSTPMDVLRFTPLSLLGRMRLGLLALRARRVRAWHELEELTAEEWLVKLGGREVYEVVWKPLLEGKFGPYAREISAVWFWNKLKLRGGSRGKGGAEVLAYYRGGFAALAHEIAQSIRHGGGAILLGSPVTGLIVRDGHIRGVHTEGGPLLADAVLATPALPIVADLVTPYVSPRYTEELRQIHYLANICIVLELDRSLSETYWLNVNDPGFPFVGVIEHTNFEPPESYAGRRLVYLSRYLPDTDELYRMPDEAVVEYCLSHLKRMFPDLDDTWVLAAHVWRARFAQPIVVRRYGSLIPPLETPLQRLYLSSMAQVYPEDRGTNYAIREGRAAGRRIAEVLLQAPHLPDRRELPPDEGGTASKAVALHAD
jgi:protoporphyrinogen oxidase